MTGGDNDEYGEDGKPIEERAHDWAAGEGQTWQAHAAHEAEIAHQDPGYEAGAAVPVEHEHALPGLHHEDRLPWLESGDDEDETGIDARRVWAFVIAGLALLALIVGGVWWSTHRSETGPQVADGSTVPAPAGAYKAAPKDPGGKTFAGTGDSSFAVSQGHSPEAKLASPAPASAPSAAAPAGGIGVQVGAFSSQAAAETAWGKLAKANDMLSGVAHRIVEGKADIGTVYRLQAVAGSEDAAAALCGKLKAAGVNCQVKD